MRAPAAPPAWVMALPLDPGAWRVLVGLWSYADFDASGYQLIGPSRSKIAARLGIKTSGLRKQLVKLRALGWVRDDHSSKDFKHLGLGLAWGSPFESGTGGPVQVARSVQVDTAPGGAPAGPPGPAKRSRCPAKAVQVDTHTLQDLASPSSDLAAAHTTPSESTTPLPAAYPEHVRAKHAQVTQSSHAAPPGNSNGSPAGGHSPGELDPEVWRAIEDHDQGRWAQSLMGANWVTSLAQAMDDLNLDTDRVLAVLDAWSQQASGGVPPGMPSRRELWWAGGGRGKLVARPWLLHTLEATRAKLRVVSADEEYERALADAYR